MAVQLDLYGERGLGEADRAPAAVIPRAGASVSELTGGAVIEAFW